MNLLKQFYSKIKDSKSILLDLSKNNNNVVLQERMYNNSWAAKKIIDIPVDDMFIYDRKIYNIDDNHIAFLENCYKNLALKEKISEAIKKSRIYGTCFLLLVSKNGMLNTPVTKISNITNVIVIPKKDNNITISDINSDINDIGFGEPLSYDIYFNKQKNNIHSSRMIRIDNTPIDKYSSYLEDKWGKSLFESCFSNISSEISAFDVVDKLILESSVPIIKAPNLSDALSGDRDALYLSKNDNQNVFQKMLNKLNSNKSVYKTILIDNAMDISRLEPSFSNLDKIIDRINQRLCACEDIPQSRFFGDTPSGLNASGHSDMHNYAIKISSMQNKILRKIYDKLDSIFLGNDIEVKYSFQPIINIDDETKAKISLTNAQRDQINLQNGLITEEEARSSLRKEEIYELEDDEAVSNEIQSMIKENGKV